MQHVGIYLDYLIL